jgi:hypothetical protein
LILWCKHNLFHNEYNIDIIAKTGEEVKLKSMFFSLIFESIKATMKTELMKQRCLKMRKNQVYQTTSEIADIPVGHKMQVMKGGKNPVMGFIDPERGVPVSVNGDFSRVLELSDKVESHDLLKGWRISKNKEFETSRGVAFEIVIAYRNKDMVRISNDGNGGMNMMEDLTSINASAKLLQNIRDAFADVGYPFSDKTQDEFVVDEFIFYEINNLRPILTLKDYLFFEKKAVS